MERLTDSSKEIPSLTGKHERKWLSIYFELKDYEDAKENGLLVRLPCKIGTKLYHINGKFILEFTVYSFNVDENGAWLIHVEYYSKETQRTFSRCFESDEIGKTVFLTQEEAEAKLKEMEGKNANSD